MEIQNNRPFGRRCGDQCTKARDPIAFFNASNRSSFEFIRRKRQHDRCRNVLGTARFKKQYIAAARGAWRQSEQVRRSPCRWRDRRRGAAGSALRRQSVAKTEPDRVGAVIITLVSGLVVERSLVIGARVKSGARCSLSAMQKPFAPVNRAARGGIATRRL